MTDSEKRRQLYRCCDKYPGDAILKGHADVVNLSERELLRIIKHFAVIPTLMFVRRSDFLSTRQDFTGSTRSFAARLKRKTSTCFYTCTYSKDCF